VAVICLFPAARYKPRVIEFPPLYEVQLVKIEPVRRAPPPKPARKKPVQPKKKAPKVVTPKVEPKKKPKEKPKEKPKVEPPKPVKKEEPEPAKPPPPPAPKVATKARIEVDVPSWYCDTIEQIVTRHWDEPIVSPEVLLETVIYFDILRSGEVASARIEKESGDRRWDLAGLRAVMESRFPPLPSEYKRERLEFAVGFMSAGATAAQ
jgi:protein TonB